MYHFYSYIPESKKSWRSAYEVQVAAVEHEKRRLQREDVAPMAKPQKTNR